MKELILASLFYIPVGSIDIASTQYTLSRCGPYCKEANPIAGWPSKLVISTGLAVVDSKAKSKKQKKIMKIAWLTLNISVAAWNLHYAKKH